MNPETPATGSPPRSGSTATFDGAEQGAGFWAGRLGLTALRYPIPRGATTLRYSLGALTLASFLVLAVTGVWLAQFYNPSPAGAHDSVLYIITRAPFGDIARNLHYWAGHLMVITIIAHLAWVFYNRGYRRPRELTWYAGLGMAALVFLLIVTGTTLRHDQEGYEALAHFLAGAELAGGLGRLFAAGFTLSTPVLARIFALHTSLLPLGLVALLALHLWLVGSLGVSAAGAKDTTFIAHLPRLVGLGLLLCALLAVLAIVRSEGIGHAPVAGYEITKPTWSLLWIYALESLFGMSALIWAPALVFVFLALVPIVDRPGASARTVWALRAVGAATLVVLGGLALWAALSPPQQHLGM